MARLAELLHVSADYLLSDGKEPAATHETQDARAADLLVKELSAMFAGGRLSEEDRDAAMEAIQQAYWDGRRISREKKH